MKRAAACPFSALFFGGKKREGKAGTAEAKAFLGLLGEWPCISAEFRVGFIGSP